VKEDYKGICTGCMWAKSQFGAACYCIKYGYIVGYPKTECRGRENEQIQEQENNG
jgi:hypothetical protein